jgi:hypothetical protein
MRRAKYIEKILYFNEDKLHDILTLHQCSSNIIFFVQKYVVGRPISNEDKEKIARQYQMYRILSDLKQRNKV